MYTLHLPVNGASFDDVEEVLGNLTRSMGIGIHAEEDDVGLVQVVYTCSNEQLREEEFNELVEAAHDDILRKLDALQTAAR